MHRSKGNDMNQYFHALLHNGGFHSRSSMFQLTLTLDIIRWFAVLHPACRWVHHTAVHVNSTPSILVPNRTRFKTRADLLRCTIVTALHAMSDWTTTCALAIGSVLVLHIGRRALQSRSSYPLPPGPLGLPWVGNVIGVNTSTPWITYTEWARSYGR